MSWLEQLIADHPKLAVGSAFAVGLALGVFRPHGRIGRAIAAAVGGLAATAVRDAVVRSAAGYAKHWIDQRHRETRTSYEPAVETFFEH